MRKTKEEAAATRKALMEAALSVFSRQGYAATRLEDIAREAGVTRGAIYWHFGSKAELYNALMSETADRIEDVVKGAVAGGGGFIATTRRVMVRLLEFLEEDETYRAVQELMLLKTEFSPELMEGIQVKLGANRMLIERLIQLFRAGIEYGEVRADLDPRLGALGMLTYLNGVVSSWLFDPQSFSISKDAPGLVDIFIQGIIART
ncbi:MAG TPA: TetR family transcriptional regulator [Ktedonobacteraceae bacterium]|nr:TetR family transcriptional regulator [Ktedonobacteraceae bacterium]